MEIGRRCPPFWTSEESDGQEALEQMEQPNKDCHILWAFFVYSDQRSSSMFWTFLSYEELSFSFSFFFNLSSVKTKHAAYLVYAVRVTLERDETDKQKMPALLTARAQAGMIDGASTLQMVHRLLFCFVSFPPLFSASFYNHLFHYIKHSRVAKASVIMWFEVGL